MIKSKPVLLLVVCAAPPAAKVTELARLLCDDGWDVYPVLTEAAMAWVDLASLETATGHSVKSEPRGPHEPKSLPRADGIIVAPATFNTINQWAAGINNTAALGILNEALGSDTPVVASPYAKAVLTAHPAFNRNLELLTSAGVRFTPVDALRPDTQDGPFLWAGLLNLLKRHLKGSHAATPSEDMRDEPHGAMEDR